jgi:hypothetical protein
MICTLSNRYLDYSIIDINVQWHLDVERIQEELNKEFEWDGPRAHTPCPEKNIGSFLKQKRARLKWLWLKNPECDPPTCCDSWSWEKLKEY